MKEKEGIIDCPEQQMILYVEKEDGNYGPIQTGSYISANFLDDYFLKRRNLERALRQQVANGEISPVKYYMVLEDLSLSELSARAGIRKSRVQKHMETRNFGKITLTELHRYADVFNIPPANLLQLLLVKVDSDFESHLIIENQAKSISVAQEKTRNPYIVLTKIEERL